jgi:DNA invertase Pin-like site-specific DNA recombinase
MRSGPRRAAIYLRVSSVRQANVDYDPEGFSIPAQREACIRKAASLEAEVVAEFIDRGESAKTADRPDLKRMLDRLATEKDIDLVIVHKVDRLARSRADDVSIGVQIRAAGAQLVSATENIDETPSGLLLHGIMSSIAEFYSRNLASEVIKGATEKARRGGTPGIAPLGYLNVRETVDDREVRTVALDPERAPLIKLAFDLYATGRFSVNELVTLLAAKGLRSRGNRRYSPRPLNHSSLHAILSNDYYAGWVRYRKQRYRGRHEPLVSQMRFDEVQAVLRAHCLSGERKRKGTTHYLKGTLHCDDCGLRLTHSRNSGNGGTYEYFVCPNKQRRQCDQPYHRVEVVEAAVERYYRKVQLSKSRQRRVRAAIKARLDEMAAISERELARCNGELRTLDEQERTLLQKHYQGRVSDKLYDEEQRRIATEREAAEAIIARLSVQFGDIEETLDLALSLTDDIQAAYIKASPTVRRLFNQAIFEWIKISSEEVSEVELAEPFRDLLADDLLVVLEAPENDQTPDPVGQGALVAGSISGCGVVPAGFEPATVGFRTPATLCRSRRPPASPRSSPPRWRGRGRRRRSAASGSPRSRRRVSARRGRSRPQPRRGGRASPPGGRPACVPGPGRCAGSASALRPPGRSR